MIVILIREFNSCYDFIEAFAAEPDMLEMNFGVNFLALEGNFDWGVLKVIVIFDFDNSFVGVLVKNFEEVNCIVFHRQ